MTTKLAVKEMCDAILKGLDWIDNEPDSELIQKLKEYRRELIEYPDVYVEGTMTVFPLDPRVRL
jgi:hypothetical protein